MRAFLFSYMPMFLCTAAVAATFHISNFFMVTLKDATSRAQPFARGVRSCWLTVWKKPKRKLIFTGDFNHLDFLLRRNVHFVLRTIDALGQLAAFGCNIVLTSRLISSVTAFSSNFPMQLWRIEGMNDMLISAFFQLRNVDAHASSVCR